MKKEKKEMYKDRVIFRRKKSKTLKLFATFFLH